MSQTTGEQLKKARAKRGLTIEQASQATHIRSFYLEALENDQRDSLPSPVQARGFLRMYAELLKLPVEQILATWDGKVPQQDSSFPDVNSSDPQQIQAAPVPRPPTVEERTLPVEDLPEDLEEEIVPPPVDPVTESLTDDKSSAIFTEIGRTLRKQRETLGLSLTEVEQYTRLRQHYVQAMEDGRIDRLPSPVQGRGMLSNYASFLNLDEDKLMLRFAEGLMARRLEKIPAPEPQSLFNSKKRPARQAPFWRRFLTPDLLFGVIVAGIILFFSLWTAAQINNLRTTEKQPTPPDVAAVLLTPLAGTSVTGTPGTTTPKAPTVVSGETTIGTESQTAVPPGQALIGETVTALPRTMEAGASQSNNGTPLPPGVTATIPPINKDPLQVYIIARQRAWLRIIADDKIKFLGRTVPGNAYAFSAVKRLELLTGDASAIQVYFNQNDLGTLGTQSQVVGLVFVPQGIFTPTAAFTPTSTATKPATATSMPTITPLASPTITPYIPK